ncbi:MAG TPA: type II secretion system F family protein [Gemmatimonadota bacterium]|nr:type II secretion system F family protein [Gemmatimonadota bacterium]
MTYLIAVLIMTAVTLTVFIAAILVPARPREIRRRLTEIDAQHDRMAPRRRQRQQQRREQLEALAGVLGDRLANREDDTSELRSLLTRAGFRAPSAVATFLVTRFLLAAGLAGAVFLPLSLAGAGGRTMALAACAGLLGWIAPKFYLGRRQKKRAREVQLALPDMLDMLVVCVEAGMGLNQAMVRVAEEMSTLCKTLSEEVHFANLEIQTGTPRDEALRNLGERTGSEDLRALAAMLIQTDRFGTSIGRALRVHSETLRTKRRQRAEEAAAKTTIKLVFPLVLFIFPAMFVVILGPAMLHIFRTMGNLTQ